MPLAPSLILSDPPPLIPAALKHFPYRVRPFPFASLVAGASLTTLELATPDASLPVAPPNSDRVQ
jgi:hypothetical protein